MHRVVFNCGSFLTAMISRL